MNIPEIPLVEEKGVYSTQHYSRQSSYSSLPLGSTLCMLMTNTLTLYLTS